MLTEPAKKHRNKKTEPLSKKTLAKVPMPMVATSAAVTMPPAIEEAPPKKTRPKKHVTAQKFGLWRLPTVLEIVGLCRTSWLDGVREGRYPRPIKISKRAVAWKSESVLAVLEKLAAEQQA